MRKTICGIDEVKALLSTGKNLVLAGDEKALSQLPKGRWIAGTIPYFMGVHGGEFSQDQIYVTELPAYVVNADVKVYDEETIDLVYSDAPQNGFSMIIIPATSQTHLSFSINAPSFPDFAVRPLIGWVSGVFLDDLGKVSPKVFDGTQGKAIENSAVVMHVELPADKLVNVGIVNIFEQGNGDTLVFPNDGFSATDVLVNGQKRNFADYITENNIDTKLPLVADLYGAMINTSFQNVESAEKRVNFYAPVFAGMKYRIAKPINNYVDRFHAHVPENIGDTTFFSCNCILNYLYAELEGKKTADFTGPITFGEIAYQLLNQTLAYITIEDARSAVKNDWDKLSA